MFLLLLLRKECRSRIIIILVILNRIADINIFFPRVTLETVDCLDLSESQVLMVRPEVMDHVD